MARQVAIDRAAGKIQVPHAPVASTPTRAGRVRVLTFLLPVFIPDIPHDLFLHERDRWLASGINPC